MIPKTVKFSAIGCMIIEISFLVAKIFSTIKINEKNPFLLNCHWTYARWTIEISVHNSQYLSTNNTEVLDLNNVESSLSNIQSLENEYK